VASLQTVLNRQGSIAAEPFPFGPLGGQHGAPNEFTWHRLVAAAKRHLEDTSLAEFAVDPAALVGGWVPDVELPLNLSQPTVRTRFFARAQETIVGHADRFVASRWL
jgi:hypothetical protein